MKQKYFLVPLLIISLAGFSAAQMPLSYEIRQSMDFYQANKFLSGDWKSHLTEIDIAGSPYLNDEFINGSIFTVQRQQFVDIQLRYNIYNDDLEFITPGNEVRALAAPEIVEKAVFGAVQLIYLPYYQANKIIKGFFLLLEEGKASLCAKPVILLRAPTEAGAYKEPEPAKFVKKADEYYIRTGIEPAILIKTKKDLIMAFPDNHEKIESFVDKNKIKPNKAEDLTKVVKYYNSL